MEGFGTYLINSWMGVRRKVGGGVAGGVCRSGMRSAFWHSGSSWTRTRRRLVRTPRRVLYSFRIALAYT